MAVPHPPTDPNRAHFTLKKKICRHKKMRNPNVRNIFILQADLKWLRQKFPPEKLLSVLERK